MGRINIHNWLASISPRSEQLPPNMVEIKQARFDHTVLTLEYAASVETESTASVDECVDRPCPRKQALLARQHKHAYEIATFGDSTKQMPDALRRFVNGLRSITARVVGNAKRIFQFSDNEKIIDEARDTIL